MPLVLILGIMFVLSVIFPRATKALIVAPILGIVFGGLAWSIIAMIDRNFNTFSFFLTVVGLTVGLMEVIVHWDDICE